MLKRDDELANKIIQLQEEVNTLKTSQPIGTSSNILIPVYEIDETLSTTSSWVLNYKFRSEGVISPLIMPKITTLTFGGSNIIGWIDYNRYTTLSDRGNQTAFMNPYLTGFNLSPSPDDPHSSSRKTLRVQGTIYANCRGVIERTWYEGTF